MSLLDKVRGLRQFEEVSVTPGKHRVHVDGDYLAYWAACKDDTPPGIAREVAYNKLQKIKHDARASGIVLHLTTADSDKGLRYLIAETKPYQQQRGGGKPKNWEALRIWMEAGDCGPDVEVMQWHDREADDGAAYYVSRSGFVDLLCFADKDLRMVPASHIVWDSHERVDVQDGQFSVEHNGKIYGPRWFWIQMLAGDPVDNIPGLPMYRVSKDKWQRIAEVRATKLIPADLTPELAGRFVLQQYRAYGRKYGIDGWRLFCEQAMLLWMRQSDDAFAGEFMHRCGLGSEHLGLSQTVYKILQDVREKQAVLEEIKRAAAENYGG